MGKSSNINIPNHIAIIMDGNGRWAKKRLLPRIAGHKQGMNTVKKIAIAANDLGIKVLTLYAFSTENWSRPDGEVNFLMKLPIDFFNDFVPDLIKNNVRVQVIGDIDKLPENTQKAVYDAIEQTKDCTGMILNFALNYGGRLEIVEAIKKIAFDVKENQLSLEQINEKLVSSYLYTGYLNELADPDLVIRTSGEHRTSNFLPWQTAYAEYYFTNVLWPDFDENDLKDALDSYLHRDRRFGGIKTEKN